MRKAEPNAELNSGSCALVCVAKMWCIFSTITAALTSEWNTEGPFKCNKSYAHLIDFVMHYVNILNRKEKLKKIMEAKS